MSEPESPTTPAPPIAPPRGKRILSGVRPTGTLHIGNYLGAVRQHIALSRENDGRYFIADYHSMTTLYDAAERRSLTHALALDYLALGLDPSHAMLYRQSDVPEVTELCWILATVTPVGLLERAHAYKDKLASGEASGAGLLLYPVLMAADILIHRAQVVPVGQDQKQHIEIARDLAQKINLRYGEVLALPEPYILESVGTVPGVDGRKMSKSYGNTIEPFAPAKALRKQVMRIVTDSTPVEVPKDPELALYQLWKLFASPCEWAEMKARCAAGGQGYGDVKKDLAERIVRYFGEARERRETLAMRPGEVEDILADGARRVREDASPLLDALRRVCGIARPAR
jgi:tryptophanyl-tRNA synthetase